MKTFIKRYFNFSITAVLAFSLFFFIPEYLMWNFGNLTTEFLGAVLVTTFLLCFALFFVNKGITYKVPIFLKRNLPLLLTIIVAYEITVVLLKTFNAQFIVDTKQGGMNKRLVFFIIPLAMLGAILLSIVLSKLVSLTKKTALDNNPKTNPLYASILIFISIILLFALPFAIYSLNEALLDRQSGIFATLLVLSLYLFQHYFLVVFCVSIWKSRNSENNIKPSFIRDSLNLFKTIIISSVFADIFVFILIFVYNINLGVEAILWVFGVFFPLIFIQAIFAFAAIILGKAFVILFSKKKASKQ